MKKPVDLRAVAQARRNLELIKRAHPRLGGTADVNQWTEVLEKDNEMAATQQAAFRLPVELLGRLDKHAKQLQEASPGMTITRTDVVRMLLTQGLDDAEKKPKRSPKR